MTAMNADTTGIAIVAAPMHPEDVRIRTYDMRMVWSAQSSTERASQ